MTSNKFEFYQEVEIGLEHENPRYRGLKGAVLGVSEEDGIVYGYSVLIHGFEELICFKANDLSGTGKKFSREDYY